MNIPNKDFDVKKGSKSSFLAAKMNTQQQENDLFFWEN